MNPKLLRTLLRLIAPFLGEALEGLSAKAIAWIRKWVAEAAEEGGTGAEKKAYVDAKIASHPAEFGDVPKRKINALVELAVVAHQDEKAEEEEEAA